MQPQRQVFAMLVATTILPAAGAAAAITASKASIDFPAAGKFEMVTPTDEVDPAGSTSTWTRGGSGATPTLLGGALQLDTPLINDMFWRWTGTNVWGSATSATGWTVEFALRTDIARDPGALGRVFDLWVGDGSKTFLLTVGLDSTRFAIGYNSLLTADNTDDYHVFRLASEGGTNVIQVWRDGVPIGVDLPPTGYIDNDFYFGDGTGSFSGSGAYDYVRIDTTGAYLPVVPEPASLALFAGSSLLLFRRRTSAAARGAFIG